MNEDGTETWWPVNRTSRSLTKTQMGYPQIDGESLAKSWGMSQNRYYLIGRPFVTLTDHRPLFPFYNHTKKATPRIERHILRIQDLNFRMEYMSGKTNPSDWYSRNPDSIDDWTLHEKERHDIDTGVELQLNRVLAVKKLDKFLHI